MESFLPYTRPEPLLKVLHHIYLPAISFFWGYLKSKVYVRKPRTVDDLKVCFALKVSGFREAAIC